MPWETVYKPFVPLFNDGKRLSILAKEAADAGNQDEDTFAQSAILLLVFATEALINQVIEDFTPLVEALKAQLMKISLPEKFAYVPALCGGTVKQPFDPQVEPFKTFVAMVATRHLWVHPKPKKLPVDEFLGGAPATSAFPRLPLHARAHHAERAVSTTKAIVEWLQSTMPDRVQKSWMGGAPITWSDPRPPSGRKRGRKPRP